MIYRTYGSTGIKVSAIGFGGMRFHDQKDIETCVSLMHAAYDAGINFFDTAIGYGKSEELFGAALKQMLKTRDQRPFYISTKTNAGDEKQSGRTWRHRFAGWGFKPSIFIMYGV